MGSHHVSLLKVCRFPCMHAQNFSCELASSPNRPSPRISPLERTHLVGSGAARLEILK
ncbi:hypothetical protein TIFTF001_050537 [Ficus carica]|uniref:Uncharacterized protein n=1 Tax=Ficus carica TaxID=3494 RepID=A0AA87ZBH3_FICCA|nr:hypothetical protein TIFTF001_050537 [Ficus carica]